MANRLLLLFLCRDISTQNTLINWISLKQAFYLKRENVRYLFSDKGNIILINIETQFTVLYNYFEYVTSPKTIFIHTVMNRVYSLVCSVYLHSGMRKSIHMVDTSTVTRQGCKENDIRDDIIWQRCGRTEAISNDQTAHYMLGNDFQKHFSRLRAVHNN